MRTLLAVLATVALCSSACSKKEPAPPSAPELPKPAADAVKLGQQAAAQGLPAPAPVPDAKALLTDEKLGKFVSYQRAMLPATALVLGAGLAAMARSDGDSQKLQDSLGRDERMRKVAEIEAQALAQSGLTREETTQLTHLTSSYIARRSMAATAERELADAQKRLEEAKAKPKKAGAIDRVATEEAHVKSLTSRVAEAQTLREDFAAKYGKEALEALDKHEKELLANQEEMLKAALGGAKK